MQESPVLARPDRPPPELSVVVPMYNEQTNVEAFVAAVSGVLVSAGLDHEIVLVDDGSSDGTWAAIVAAARAQPSVRGVSLSRNFGHQGALLAGLNHARGRAVITMDGDLQHPPESLPELVTAWREGYKIVNTRRLDSEDTPFFKRFTSRGFYWLFSQLTGVKMEAGASDFRLMDRDAVEALVRLGDADPFIRGLVSWLGFRTRTLPYQARRRHSGVPKFTLKKMLRLSTGAMLSFSAFPLRLGIGVGFVTSALAFVELCYILVQYLRGHVIPGWASVMTVMSLMFGVLFVLLGIIGTYLAKVYEILKRRPRFVVGDRAGFDAASDPVPEHDRSPPTNPARSDRW
ncbi:MAG TPA: glycosyltransferase family 2 protein [Polyangiaceae bacterium]|jgi:dolichol-phosphate mannosyltransferase|nr:glycosyltransferase family 2 protein [Polyangiaceae bacterium]